jgi:hypothetical protein
LLLTALPAAAAAAAAAIKQVRELHDEAVFETECLGVSDPGMEKVRRRAQRKWECLDIEFQYD